MKAILAANGADLATFALAVGVVGIPISAESNPTMTAAYLAAGLLGVAVWKASLTATLVLLVGRVRSRSRRVPILVAYAIGLVGAASNVVAILR